MSKPVERQEHGELRRLTSSFTNGEDLTASQRRRLEHRGKERRRVSIGALTLRFKAVFVAYKRARDTGELQPLVGELENVASACMAWARYIRSTKHL